MIVIFDKSFLKSIDKLRNPTTKKTIEELNTKFRTSENH
jgi:hypothetical protein